MVLIEVGCDFPQGKIGRDVGIHRDSVRGEEASVWWEGNAVKLLLQREAVLEVGALPLCSQLELGVAPDTKSVEERATGRDDGPGRKGSLVHLGSGVECAEDTSVVGTMVAEEGTLFLGEVLRTEAVPVVKEANNGLGDNIGLDRGKAAVRICIAEVVTDHKLDVLVAFDDSRAKVLVAVDDKKVALRTEVLEGAALVRKQVRAAAFFVDKGPEGKREASEPLD